MRTKWLSTLTLAAVLLLAHAQARGATALGTAFTYQGQLKLSGSALTGTADFQFSLWDVAGSGNPPTGGTQIGSTDSLGTVTVTNGFFTVQLDFGGSAFLGDAGWLQIAVRSPAGSGLYTTLAPRQALTPAPYSIGLRLPFSGSGAGTYPGGAFVITNTGNGYAIEAISPAGAGAYGRNGGGSGLSPYLGFGMGVWGDTDNGYGIVGTSASAWGVYGKQGGAAGFAPPAAGGVFGESSNNMGVIGLSGSNYAVYGNSSTSDGVYGNSSTGDGVHGEGGNAGVTGNSNAGYGVVGNGATEGVNGDSFFGIGVHGTSFGIGQIPSGRGVVGEATTNTGVEGDSVSGTGVYGHSSSGRAVYGVSTSWDGVGGISTAASGVYGKSTNGWGVFGQSDSSHGVHGVTNATTFNTAGVLGEANGNGQVIGVYGSASTGTNAAGVVGIGATGGYFRSNGLGINTALYADGLAQVKCLNILGGCDLAEGFDVSGENAEPGVVLVIDEEHEGELKVASTPYDRKVAGIISGAGGIHTGMVMSQSGATADGKHQVALTGRVYCKCDASFGPIAPGDLLTTCATPGHAMKVTDHSKAQGATIGKAMTALKQGRGLVLVLVTLQ